MEERKKSQPLGVIGLILLYLILILLCFASLGLQDWSLGLGPWGVYSTDDTSVYLNRAYDLTGPQDLLITRRDGTAADGQLVTYLRENARTVDLFNEKTGLPVLMDKPSGERVEPVLWLLRDGGTLARELYRYRWYFRAALAACILLRIIWRATALSRWSKREQKLFLRGLKTYGEQYLAQDETANY